jgi:hypothetical protein
MARKLDPKETVELKDLLISEVIQSEALIDLLERKGILTRKELLEEINRIAAKMPKAQT